jgi:uracil phosphoribosyltransferase
MIIRSKWTEPPLFTSINSTTGAVLIVEKERISEVDPTTYEAPKLKMKNKSEKAKSVVCGYVLRQGRYVLFMGEENVTKLGVVEYL